MQAFLPPPALDRIIVAPGGRVPRGPRVAERYDGRGGGGVQGPPRRGALPERLRRRPGCVQPGPIWEFALDVGCFQHNTSFSFIM